MLACRSRWIDGSATFTTVLSSMIMNRAKHMAASVHHLRLSSFRRMRSGMSGGVLSEDAERRDVLARADRSEGLGELASLLRAQGLDEVCDAGDAQVDEAGGLLAGAVGCAHCLEPAVARALGACHEA